MSTQSTVHFTKRSRNSSLFTLQQMGHGIVISVHFFTTFVRLCSVQCMKDLLT